MKLIFGLIGLVLDLVQDLESFQYEGSDGHNRTLIVISTGKCLDFALAR